ncbi:conserved Plasmodium protein, unknown function [Plasmodium gallinaceum]|uniref:Uncharacterized protein n=1 Tax=Plasmodium gallinaceum TaxID=5849 RepID=A0A1J1GWA3_PLAGA|nr:conserved Plasmodium protein, unknown function [Plasmodium gallinaceum]CRG95293.1 conserved Plasmodium protein, unknown function [Plasmodium gallinaceum]
MTLININKIIKKTFKSEINILKNNNIPNNNLRDIGKRYSTIQRPNLYIEKKNSFFMNYRSLSNSKIFLNKDNDFYEGEHLNRKLGGYGYPMMFIVTYDKPSWQPFWENDCEVIPRDEFGVPASLPPEVSTKIKHTYYVPPQFYTFLKKLGDDSAELKPYMTKLIKGEFTYDDYQEMFYKFAKPLKIYRKKIPIPYRTAEEMAREEEMKWQSSWYTYRQKVLAEYNVTMCLREFILYMTVGLYFAYLWLDALRQYRLDMKLFYLEAPEHKINWVKPRGDLV